METKISVVIPTYKRPKLLIDCLTALSKQTLAKDNFEVNIVSDGPDPETFQQIQQWVKSDTLTINYHETEEKGGPAAARNLGWRSANFSLIAFTDDDCQPSPDWLESFLKNYKGEEHLAFSGFTYVPLPDHPSDYELNTANLQTADFITANCACTFQALVKVRGFDERFKAAWREDSDLEFKLLTHQIPIVKIKEALVVHPVRQVPWGVSIKEQKKGIYDVLLYKKFPHLYRSNIQSKPLWNYYLINLLWMIIFVSLIAGSSSFFRIALFSQTILLLHFTYKRLRFSKKSISHTLEMFGTSIIIPTLSVYWRIYGSMKYRVVLL